MAHTHFVAGESEQGIAAATAYAEQELGLGGPANPDLVVLRYTLFSVDEARRLMDIACAAPVGGEQKAIIVSTTRFFHEAQNALLKLFEEPPRGVALMLVVPSAGVLLPTLRSRLTELPQKGGSAALNEQAREFLKANADERGKMIERLINRSKSDKDEEKQAARSEAVRLAEELLTAAHAVRESAKSPQEKRELQLFEHDLLRFLPLLHTRPAPLKLIFEHLLLVIPTGLSRAKV